MQYLLTLPPTLESQGFPVLSSLWVPNPHLHPHPAHLQGHSQPSTGEAAHPQEPPLLLASGVPKMLTLSPGPSTLHHFQCPPRLLSQFYVILSEP